MTMTAEQIEILFTRRDGQFSFARWGRPIAPVAFGIEQVARGPAPQREGGGRVVSSPPI